MIDPLSICIVFDNMDIFKDIPNITYDENADITINMPKAGRYNIAYYPVHQNIEDIDEVWVNTQEERVNHEKFFDDVPIIVLTEDDGLLPYCMKDRLAYLQDKINKEKGRYK